jgi:protein-disulfide isomerase
MDSLKRSIAVCALALGALGYADAQTPAAAPKPAAPPTQPLKLQSLDPATKADPFSPVDPKLFTASSPSVQTVDAFLQATWGYDVNRIWRVQGIEKTEAPGVSKVVVQVSEKTSNAPVQSVAFFVMPDGGHAIAGSALVAFGPKPFGENRAKLEARADGPAVGAASKSLLLVEFSDLQCPHCKDAQATMKNLEQDYPMARIVYQPFPLMQIHPYAFQAAAYGLCVAKQKNDAYATYAQAVYDTQAALTAETGETTLKAAVTKAGLDPAAVAACSSTSAIAAQLKASLKLGEEIGVDQTPMLAVNGRLLPLGSIPYETLKQILDFTMKQDGVAGGQPVLNLR